MTVSLASRVRPSSAFADISLAVGFVVMWSSGFIGAELGTRAAGALTLLAWRAVIGAVVLVAWRVRGAGLRLARGEMAVHAIIGVLGQAGYLAGVVLAVEFGVPAGTVALVAALQPVTAGVVAGPVLGEKVSARQWAGLLVGLIGVAMVVGGDLTSTGDVRGWAYLLPFLAMASLVAATLLDRRVASRVDLADGLTIQTAAAALVLVAAAANTGTLVAPTSIEFWAAVAWTVVLSHIGGYALYWLNVRRGGVTRVGVLLYLTPGATAVWALAMFGQPMDALSIAGMAVSLAAVAFALKPRRRT